MARSRCCCCCYRARLLIKKMDVCRVKAEWQLPCFLRNFIRKFEISLLKSLLSSKRRLSVCVCSTVVPLLLCCRWWLERCEMCAGRHYTVNGDTRVWRYLDCWCSELVLLRVIYWRDAISEINIKVVEIVCDLSVILNIFFLCVVMWNFKFGWRKNIINWLHSLNCMDILNSLFSDFSFI